MAAPRCSMFLFCGGGKVGGDNNRLLRDDSFESCLTEQRCSVDLPCVTFCFENCQNFRLLTRGLSLKSIKLIDWHLVDSLWWMHERLLRSLCWMHERLLRQSFCLHSQPPPRKLCVDDESLDSLGWCALVSPLFWVPYIRVSYRRRCCGFWVMTFWLFGRLSLLQKRGRRNHYFSHETNPPYPCAGNI